MREREDLSDLKAALIDRLPRRRRQLTDAFADLEGDRLRLMRLCVFALAQGDAESLAADVQFFLEAMKREQLHFAAKGRYRYRSVEELRRNVYRNADYMRRFRRGRTVELLLNPQCAELLKFYCAARIECSSGAFLAAAGDGILLAQTLEAGGMDAYALIGEYAEELAFLRDLTAGCAHADSLSCREGAFSQAEEESCALVLLNGILERTEQPLALLENARGLLSADGRIFLTAVLNAPATEYIRLYARTEELHSLIREAGLRIADRTALPFENYTADECERKCLPLCAVYLLGKA
ncbi:MAG: hypothetical protein LUC40_06935 [Oscillospiraceae bacterium]|nr:hypothetical protein [Oscillospiraceae bacterium]